MNLLHSPWKREKYDASENNNPIRDALEDKGLHSLPYHMDGGAILDTLCPNTIKTIVGKYRSEEQILLSDLIVQ